MKKLFSVSLLGVAALLSACANQPTEQQDLSEITARYINATPQQVLSVAKDVFNDEFPDGYNYGMSQNMLTVIHPHTSRGVITGSTDSNFRKVYVEPTNNGQTYVRLQASDLKAGAPGQSVLRQADQEWTNIYGVQPKPEYYEKFFETLESGLEIQRAAASTSAGY